MIESKRTRERVSETITYWAKHTHADRELREGDIPNLVSQIQDIFYHIGLSCGHKVSSMEEGVEVAHVDVDREGDLEVITGSYCQDCADEYLANPLFRAVKIVDGTEVEKLLEEIKK